MVFAVRLVQDKLVNTHEIFALLHTSAEEARHCGGVSPNVLTFYRRAKAAGSRTH